MEGDEASGGLPYPEIVRGECFTYHSFSKNMVLDADGTAVGDPHGRRSTPTLILSDYPDHLF